MQPKKNGADKQYFSGTNNTVNNEAKINNDKVMIIEEIFFVMYLKFKINNLMINLKPSYNDLVFVFFSIVFILSPLNSHEDSSEYLLSFSKK